ncbi:MAG: DsbA family protein [Proteobacteria bacterium]|nr:DsbA family protein [Pseudomonadota bacterium]MBU1696475.1 DsbA family protein [Pseudomonadota bacterium]
MDKKKINNKTQSSKTDAFDLVQPRNATGKAPVLVEIICERVHCVMYDYAINTVDMVVENFGDQIDIQTIVRRGELKNAMRFLSLCKKAGKMLSVPTILINGDVAFTNVPHPDDLKSAIEKYLIPSHDSPIRKD